MMVRPSQMRRALWGSDMSKRNDPNLGQKRAGNTPKRARQMTVYDRLEDARRRRKELLAKGTGPAPRTVPSHTASNKPTAPFRAEQSAPSVETAQAPEPVIRAHAPDRTQHSKPEPNRTRGGYWSGLAQAMAAVAVIAVLIAVFRPFEGEPQATATAAAPLTPEPLEKAPIAQSAEAERVFIVPRFTVSTTSPVPVPDLDPTPLGLTIAPLVSPTFKTVVSRLDTPSPGSLPSALLASDLPAPPEATFPLVLTSTPPARPGSTPPAASTGLADATNVVLLVPAFVPQASAEEAITAAAALGIPVDQTRRASVSISRTNIRYYHEEDAEAATILASGIGGIARDFTDFTPPPNPGVIEVWLEGRGGGGISSSNQGSATVRGIEADLAALRNSIARALNAATGN